MQVKIEIDLDDAINELHYSDRAELATKLAKDYLDSVELTQIALQEGEVSDILDQIDNDDIVDYLSQNGYKIVEE